MKKIILVTGSNRGIGLEICRQLSNQGHTVILTSRNIAKGQVAISLLGNGVIAKQLDVTNEESILKLYNSITTEFGRIDVLINNAGIGVENEFYHNALFTRLKNSLKSQIKGPFKFIRSLMPLVKKSGIELLKPSAKDISLHSVKKIMDTNFYGAWRMIQVFIPLLNKSEDPRIINISSGMGSFDSLTGVYPGYSVSKYSLNALTIMFSNELKQSGIKVNSICPGWVKTDMGGPYATRELNEGADTAVWLCTSVNSDTGKFYKDRKEISW